MWNKGARFAAGRLALGAVAAACLAPLVYLAWQSVFVYNGFSLAGYEQVLLLDSHFYTWFWNSVGYTVGILAIQLPVSVLAAYGFSQYDFWCKRALFFLYMVLMLLPFQATVAPQFLLLHGLGLTDTRAAILLCCGFAPLGTFLLTQFMRGVPPEVVEAARLDGADCLGLLWRVLLPLCRPAITSLLVLQLLHCWSLIDQPLLFLRSQLLLPLSLQLHGEGFGAAAWAAACVYAVLPLLCYLHCQEALESGICLGSVK